MDVTTVLIVGEIFIDINLPNTNSSIKMRLGGIVHAARGLWSCNIKYSVVAVCPEFLVEEAKKFLKAHGCDEFIWLGNVVGAPNVMLIDDVREVGDQGYENIMRDSKSISYNIINENISRYTEIIIFPGSYKLGSIFALLNPDASITIDIAYNIKTIDDLKNICKRIDNISISTSSDLFLNLADNDVKDLNAACKNIGAKYLLLKENRGGSRLFDLFADKTEEIYAQLDKTVNSVGVGDAFTAVFGAYPGKDRVEAAWRGAQVATIYAQTTFPDDLHRDVGRNLKLSLSTVRSLGGTFLPWHRRKEFNIYLAAPDFSYAARSEIEAVVASLEYHNFTIRRPVKENGEADIDSTPAQLQKFYVSDVNLLHECSIVFAIPLNRDPGTLIEMGMAMELEKPVITYDPDEENKNTMVMCGSKTYSSDIDVCLNAVFECISKILRTKK